MRLNVNANQPINWVQLGPIWVWVQSNLTPGVVERGRTPERVNVNPSTNLGNPSGQSVNWAINWVELGLIQSGWSNLNEPNVNASELNHQLGPDNQPGSGLGR